jgi:hypothetical protein
MEEPAIKWKNLIQDQNHCTLVDRKLHCRTYPPNTLEKVVEVFMTCGNGCFYSVAPQNPIAKLITVSLLCRMQKMTRLGSNV